MKRSKLRNYDLALIWVVAGQKAEEFYTFQADAPCEKFPFSSHARDLMLVHVARRFTPRLTVEAPSGFASLTIDFTLIQSQWKLKLKS